MSGVITAALRELMAAGLEGEALIAAAERIEAAQVPARTARQNRNARYYQSHKAEIKSRASERRLNASEPSKQDADAPSLNDPPALTPTVEPSLNPPKEKDPKGSQKKTQNRWPEGSFDRFWAAYPNRVGKKSAMAVLRRLELSGEVTPDELLAGIENYRRSKPEHHEWKHPATWLNGGCWSDEYATPAATGPPVASTQRSLALVHANGSHTNVVQAPRKPSPISCLFDRIEARQARKRERGAVGDG